MGRDPAAVGLVDPDARRARPRLRGRDAAPRGRGLGGLHDRRRRPPPARGLPVAGLGHRPRRARAARRRPRPPSTPRSCAPADWLLQRGGHRRAATGPIRTPRARARAAGPSSSRTTSTRTWTTPPSSRSRCARWHRGHEAVDRGLAWMAGMQSRSGGWGAFDVDNEALLALQAAVLRLRQGHRRAERRRHRTRARGARAGDRLRRRGRAAGSSGCSPSRRRTAPGSAAGASTTSTAPAPRCPRSRPAGSSPATRRCRRAVAWLDSVQNEDGGFGEDIRSYADRDLARTRHQHAFPNGLGAISLRRCRRGRQPGRPVAPPSGFARTATGKRRLGGGALHRHGLPA